MEPEPERTPALPLDNDALKGLVFLLAVIIAFLVGPGILSHIVSFNLGPETGTGALGCLFNGGTRDLNLFLVHACLR